MQTFIKETFIAAGEEGVDLLFASGATIDQYLLFECANEAQVNEIVYQTNKQSINDDRTNNQTINETINRYELRGTPDQSAVLVDSSRTMSVKIVETSNTALLISNDRSMNHINKQTDNQSIDQSNNQSPNQWLIRGAITHHFECLQIKPNFESIRSKLLSNPCTETAFQSINQSVNQSNDQSMIDDEQCASLTFADMQAISQSSDQELLQALHDMSVMSFFQSNNQSIHFILDPGYHTAILSHCLNALDELKMPWKQINVVSVARSINQTNDPSNNQFSNQLVPCELTIRVLLRLTDHETACLLEQSIDQLVDLANNQSNNQTINQTIKLDPTRLIRMLSLQLFAERSQFAIDDLIARLMTMLPRFPTPMLLDPSINQSNDQSNNPLVSEAMSGFAVQINPPQSNNQSNGQPSYYKYFPVTSLQPTIRARLPQLFSEKPRWTLGEMEPYLKPICAPNEKVADVLLKQCRMNTEMIRGEKVTFYSKR